MSVLREEIEKVDLALQELQNKFQNRVKLIQDDLKNLVLEIDELKKHIEERRENSNDLTREISGLTNDLENLNKEIEQAESDKSSNEDTNAEISSEISNVNSELDSTKGKVATLETEKHTLTTALEDLKVQLDDSRQRNAELKEEYDRKIRTLIVEKDRLVKEKDGLNLKYKAVRRLCSKDYVASAETKLLKFLGEKPSYTSTLSEIQSLGMDMKIVEDLLTKLSFRHIVDYDEKNGVVKRQLDIDVFKREV